MNGIKYLGVETLDRGEFKAAADLVYISNV